MEFFTKEIKNNISVYYLDGEIDFLKAPDFKTQLLADIEESQASQIIINLKNVTYLDSSGIGALVGVISKYRDQVKMHLCSLQEPILKILKLTGLLPLFIIDKNEEESLTKLNS